MARARAPSVPGRIGTHSSALAAAWLRIGSTTTSLAPRRLASAMLRMARMGLLFAPWPSCAPQRMMWSQSSRSTSELMVPKVLKKVVCKPPPQ